MQHYRVVSLTEDDLGLIKGSPTIRRSFIDQVILLHDPDYINIIRAFNKAKDNRNALLSPKNTKIKDHDTFAILTEQLWNKSHEIQAARKKALDYFGRQIAHLADEYLQENVSISFEYKSTIANTASFEAFLEVKPSLYHDEQRVGRSLFGAHLDDFSITFADQKSRQFASRGQQKLIVLLMKIAQIKQLSNAQGPAIFLLDDFMTDFDPKRASQLLSILAHLDNQLIFTSPTQGGSLNQELQMLGAQITILTH